MSRAVRFPKLHVLTCILLGHLFPLKDSSQKQANWFVNVEIALRLIYRVRRIRDAVYYQGPPGKKWPTLHLQCFQL